MSLFKSLSRFVKVPYQTSISTARYSTSSSYYDCNGRFETAKNSDHIDTGRTTSVIISLPISESIVGIIRVTRPKSRDVNVAVNHNDGRVSFGKTTVQRYFTSRILERPLPVAHRHRLLRLIMTKVRAEVNTRSWKRIEGAARHYYWFTTG